MPIYINRYIDSVDYQKQGKIKKIWHLSFINSKNIACIYKSTIFANKIFKLWYLT